MKRANLAAANHHRLCLEHLQKRAMFAADLFGFESVPDTIKADNAETEEVQAQIDELESASRSSAEGLIGSACHRFDVNHDGLVNDLDAAHVVNHLNSKQSVHAAEGEASATPFDVSGDGFVSPLDALQIVNYLNSETDAPDGEPDQPVPNPLDVDRSGIVDRLDIELITAHIENNSAKAVTDATKHLDANRDRLISPADVLAVVNEVNKTRGTFHLDYFAATDELMVDIEELDLLNELSDAHSSQVTDS